MIKNITRDATAFFERLTSANKLAKANGFRFRRISSLDGFEEALQSLQTANLGPHSREDMG